MRVKSGNRSKGVETTRMRFYKKYMSLKEVSLEWVVLSHHYRSSKTTTIKKG
jgi:hypothetical protein